MLNFAFSASIYSLFLMSIVISNQEIYEALPKGTTESEVKTYLTDIAGSYSFVPRDSESLSAKTYPWLESEIGYYIGRVENARRNWWQPSFGLVVVAKVGISSDRKVTQVFVDGRRVGLP